MTARFAGRAGASGSVTILRVGGTEISLDWSWLLIFAFVTWTTATSVIPLRLMRDAFVSGSELGQSDTLIFVAGVITSLLFFGSILVHEGAHAYVAVRTGIPVRRIRLFIFGGVAEIASEPARPGQEFAITIVGPLASAALGAAFIGLANVLPPATLPSVTAGWLGQMNLILAVFNLLPGFPLDGGRLLRSAVWAATGNMRRATRVASTAGSGLGILLIVVGVAQLLTPIRVQLLGGGIGSIWAIFIGWFLWSAARAGYADVVRRERLSARSVRDVLRRDFYPVPQDGSVAEFLDRGLSDDRFGLRPVVDASGRLVGVLRADRALAVARDARASTRLRDIAEPIPTDGVVAPDADLAELLERAARAGRDSFFVVDQDRLVGWIHLEDALRGRVRRPGL